MSEFVSRPPSAKPAPAGTFFRGGMMPDEPRDLAALIVIDIRSLGLTADQGRELEESIREHIFERIERHTDLKERSAINLSGSVFGIAIE
jgi:hypothetical protein